MLNLRVEFETQTKPPPEWMLLKMLSICKFISRVVRFGDIRDNVIYKQWYMNEKNEEQLEGIYKHNIDTMKKLGAQRQTSCSDEFQSIKHKEGETEKRKQWVNAARRSKRIVVNNNEAQPILPQPKVSDQRDSKKMNCYFYSYFCSDSSSDDYRHSRPTEKYVSIDNDCYCSDQKYQVLLRSIHYHNRMYFPRILHELHLIYSYFLLSN